MQQLEEAIQTLIPTVISLPKDVQLVQLIVHNVPTTVLATS